MQTGGQYAAACTVPARIDTEPVTVDASDADAKEVTLNFPAVECAKESRQLPEVPEPGK